MLMKSERLTLSEICELATTPAVQNPDFPHPWWLARHQQKLEEAEKQHASVNVVFIGDSITQAWETDGKAAWDRYLSQYGAFNLGFNGDRTENVIWRLEQGALSNLIPKLYVLLIGTNNTGHRQDPPEATAKGVKHIVELLRKHCPPARVLLLGLLPRGRYHTDPMRTLNQSVNARIQTLCDEEHIFWENLDSLFLAGDEEEIHPEQMPDYLHLAGREYEKLARFLAEKIKRLIIL